jgi:mono/diheme cytochrome c family protein
MSISRVSQGVVAAILCVTAQTATAQDPDPGRLEFENQCSVCHGPDGKGNGPLADVLKVRPTDLTGLQKDNGGTLPFQQLYEIVDGRKFVGAHGAREMPIWNKRLADQAIFFLGPNATKKQIDAFVDERIRALIGYIGKLQQK